MRQSLRLFIAAVGLILCAAPVFAEEDDLLRPMIVRPTENAPTTLPKEFAPEERAPSLPPVKPSSSLRVPKVASPAPAPIMAGSSGGSGKLKVPKVSKSSPLTNTLLAAPSGSSDGDMFPSFGPSTGSTISEKVFKLRSQAVGLRQKLEQNISAFNELRGKGAAGAIQYHATVAAITARLETGTTRGNPILMRQWSEADQALSEVSYSLSRLTALSTDLSATAAVGNKLAADVKEARELPGAVDEDHVQLDMIRDEVAKANIQVDNMRGDVGKDVQRQSSYLETEKKNLQRLSQSIDRGEMIRGNDYASSAVSNALPEVGAPENNPAAMASGDGSSALAVGQDMASAPPAPILPEPAMQVTAQPPLQPPAGMQQASSTSGPGQLLVLVRFNQEVVNYEQPLYQAISDALDRKPDASFTVVAVAPRSADRAAQQGDTQSAQRHADAVKASLTQLGLQASRITSNSISSEAAMVPEVHVYVR